MRPRLPRRTALRSGGLALAGGLAGCLDVRPFESHPSTGLLLVNADDEDRTVTVQVYTPDGDEFLDSRYTVPGDETRTRDGLVENGPFEVRAFVTENGRTDWDEYFDFRGCESARIVVTVDRGMVDRIGKQDEC